MALTQGSVTINGSVGITLTNDAFGLSTASALAAPTNGMGAMLAQIASSPAGFYSYMAGSSFLAVTNNLGTVGVIGPQGSSQLLVGDGTSFFYSGPTSGSATAVIVGGNGNDTVSTGIGIDTVALGGGNNAYLIGNGGVVDSAGDADTVIGGAGSTSVTMTGASSYLASSEVPGASMTADVTGASSLIVFNVGNTTLFGATGSAMNVTNYGSLTVNAGAGGMSYAQSGGSLLLNGLAGETDNMTVSGGGPDTLYGGGTGTTTINYAATGGSSAIFVANDTTHGGTGPVDFDASSSLVGDAFWAGSGNATLIGGVGTDTMVGGHGLSTMTGGAGANNYFDLFSVNGGSGTSVTIDDFNAASGNLITLFNYGSSAASNVINNMDGNGQAQSGGNLVISLSDGSKITLVGETQFLNASQIKST